MSAVLLYYKYVDLAGQREAVRTWVLAVCTDLGLKGRIRVGNDGINATVGGSLESCNAHAAAVAAHPLLRGGDVDFKISESHGTPNESCKVESGFDTLSVRVVEELVTLGPRARGKATAANTAPHLAPAEFHDELVAAQGKAPGGAVLLDVRNVYESRIGRFEVPGIQTLAPPTRCFSELPQWLDDHAPDLHSKKVFMYCTGGVRCERASAYLREKGAGFQDAVQLKGGIVRYLEQFPGGGCFQGRNFVFDERVAHGPCVAERAVLGRCSQCGAPHDDYAARHRCRRCRLLMLVCSDCALRLPDACDAATPDMQRSDPAGGARDLLCELCLQRESHCSANGSSAQPSGAKPEQCTPVRLLAFHGFRENASRFRGRMRALLKRWRHGVTVEFVEAPHELGPASVHALVAHARRPSHNGDCGVDSGGGNSKAQLASSQHTPGASQCAAPTHCLHSSGKPKRAWFWEDAASKASADLDQTGTGCVLDRQAGGFLASIEAVSKVVAAKGPFDGIIAFSQGCAMAAAMAALQQLHNDSPDLQQPHNGASAAPQLQLVAPALRSSREAPELCADVHCVADAGNSLHTGGDTYSREVTLRVQRAMALCNWQLRFVMLCSGHVGGCAEVAAALAAAGPLRVPSLHVFGQGGADRQVHEAASEQLAACFAAPDVCMHARGHVIPSSKDDAAKYLRFFQQQCHSKSGTA